MVRLRRSYVKLKIILCSILGVFVAFGGIVGIWMLSALLQGEKNLSIPENQQNTKKELPAGKTFSELQSDGLDNLAYMAYVLENQEYYHSYAICESQAMNLSQFTQYTATFKDYKNINGTGVMVASDLTWGKVALVNEATQSLFVTSGGGAGVYMRGASGKVSSSSTGTSVSWSEDEPTYYADSEKYDSPNGYVFKYGEYSTEMTVYLLNSETVESWSEVQDNGDGTYTQKYYLNAEKAAYFYQYAMKTRGGLKSLPTFYSVTLTITFDEYYRVLEIISEEETQINKIGVMDSTSYTVTTFSYEEEDFDAAHFSYYDSYYSQYVGQLESGGSSGGETGVLDVLQGAFGEMLTGEGQQFDITLTLGGKIYYGRLFLKIDISSISSDTLNAIEARLSLSADADIDSQDLYIEFSGGEVNCYYSSDFAMTVNINDLSSVIDKFSDWISNLGTGGAQTYSASSALSEDGSFSLDELLAQLLGGLTLVDNNDGTAYVSLEIEDLYGISLSVKINCTYTEENGETVYSFAGATIGNLSIGGEPVRFSLALDTSSSATISHDKSEAAFDISVAAESIYSLLQSQSVKLDLSLSGKELGGLLESFGIDLGDALNDIALKVSANVDIEELTTEVSLDIYSVSSEFTYAKVSAYYSYDGSENSGTAYLFIQSLMGIDCDIKVYCDISEAAAPVKNIINALKQFISSTESVTPYSLLDSSADSSLADLINGVLGLDFGSLIKEVKANSSVIGATLNIDKVLYVLGYDGIALGDIELSYTISEDGSGGVLYGSADTLGLTAQISGSDYEVTVSEDGYLDLNTVLNSLDSFMSGAISGEETVGIDVALVGLSTGTVLDKYNYDIGAYVVPSAEGVGAVGAFSVKDKTDTDEVQLSFEIYYNYDGVNYGTAYISVSNILGAECEIKLYCDIKEVSEAIAELIENVSGLSGTFQNGAQLYTVDDKDGGTDIISKAEELISVVKAIDWNAFLTELQTEYASILQTVKIGSSDFIIGIDVNKLLSMMKFESEGESGSLADYIFVGDFTVTYCEGKANEEDTTKSGYFSGALVDDSNNEILSIKVYSSTAKISQPEDCLDVNTVIGIINDTLTGDGDIKSVGIEINLSGLSTDSILDEYEYTLSGAAMLGESGIGARVGLTISDGENAPVLVMSVYYEYSGANYGKAYIDITYLFGKSCAIKLYCDISEVSEKITQLIETISVSDEEGEEHSSENAATTLSANYSGLASDVENLAEKVTAIAEAIKAVDWQNVLEGLVSDLGEIFNTVTVNGNTIAVGIDTSALLKLMGISEDVLSLGKLSINYINDSFSDTSVGGYFEAVLKDSGENDMLTANVYGSSDKISMPDGEYLDISEVIAEVNAAAAAVKEIIEAQDALFEIDCTVTVNGISVSVCGKGEIRWDENGVVTDVALSLTLSVADGTSGKSSTQFDFIYNGAAEGSDAFIRLSVNGCVLNVTRDGIDDLKAKISELTSSINALLGNSSDGNETDEAQEDLINLLTDGETEMITQKEQVISDEVLTVLNLVFGILGGDSDISRGISEIFGKLLSGATVGIDELISVISSDFEISIGVVENGKLELNCSIKANGTEAIELAAGVSAGNGGLISEVNEKLDESENADGTFAQLLYNFVFDALESVDIGSFLGSRTYTATVTLCGDSSGISELEGVNVSATLYFADDNASEEGGLYVRADLELTLGKNSILKGGVIYSGRTLYLDLSEIYGIAVNNFKVKIAADDLYSAAKGIIEFIESEELLEIVNNFRTEQSGPVTGKVATLSEESSAALTDVISAILGLKFEEILKVSKNETVTIISVNANKLLGAFGITANVGTVKLSVDSGDSKKTDITVTAEGAESEWLSISGMLTEVNAAESFDADDYLDVSGLLEFLLCAINGEETVGIDFVIDNLATKTVLDNFRISAEAIVSPATDGSGASVKFAIADKQENYNIIAFSIYYVFDGTVYKDGYYGNAYIDITELFGKECSIRLFCDIGKVKESVTSLIEAIKSFGKTADGDGDSYPSEQVQALSVSGDDYYDIVGGVKNLAEKAEELISVINAVDWSGFVTSLESSVQSILKTVNIGSSDFIIGIDVNKLLSMMKFESEGNTGSLADYIFVGDFTVTYSEGKANEEDTTKSGYFSGALVDDSNKEILSIKVYSSTAKISQPEGNYVDADEVIKLIETAVGEANAIAEASSAYFEVDITVTVNDTPVGISGKGEIGWDENGVVTDVALSLTLSVADGTTESANKSSTQFDFIYNGAAKDKENYIRIAIGGYLLNITRENLDEFSSEIEEIITAINALLGNSDGDENLETEAQLLALLAESVGNSTTVLNSEGSDTSQDSLALLNVIFGELSGKGVLGTLIGQLLSGSTVTVNEAVSGIVLSFGINLGDFFTVGESGDGSLVFKADSITLSAEKDEGFVLSGCISIDDEQIAEIYATVKAGGSFVESLGETMDGYVAAESGSLKEMLFYYIFDALESVDIGSFLGSSNAYAVEFTLSGDASGISELEGVNVSATLYFAQGITNGSLENGKLLEADFDISVDEFRLSANAIYYSGYFYIEITNIGGTAIDDLKVKVSTSDIYSAVENIISLITDANVSSMLNGITGGSSASNLTVSDAQNLSDENEKTLSDILAVLLTFDYKQMVKIVSVDGGTVITADLDKLLTALGVEQKVGTATISISSGEERTVSLKIKSHKYDTEKDYYWLSLVSHVTEKRSYDSSSLSGYLDIGFVSELSGDLSKFITSNKVTAEDGTESLSTLYTFYEDSLSINLNVNIGISININIYITDIYLTVGLDENGELYMSMKGYLNNPGGLVTMTATTFGFTYSGGYITLARDIGTDDEMYWVMTPEYFIDHLFAQDSGTSDSPIRWLTRLKIAGGLYSWNSLANTLSDSISISSGLSDPDEIYLYSTQKGATADESISIFDYIKGYLVSIDGTTVSSYNSSVINSGNLNLSGDYYAFAIDGENLTGGAVSVLDLAILRSEEYGIGAINAYLSVGGMITVSLGLEYSGYQTPVDNYFDIACAAVEGGINFGYYDGDNDASADYADWIFGGVKIEGEEPVYDYSEKLIEDYVTVYVYDTDGVTLLETYYVKYGSTAYLYDFYNYPEYVEQDGKKFAVIYVQQGDESGTYPSSVTLNGKEFSFVKTQTSSEVVSLTLYNVTSDGSLQLIDEDYKLLSGSEIPTDVYSGYTLLDGKWYTDKDCTEVYNSTSATEDITLYGIFVRSTVTVNGVVYTFVNESGNAHYEITGHTTAIAAYYVEGTTLVLENEIDGYPVTRINANALQNDDNTLERGLQNVVVPENITYVGGRAFLDNYGIKTVVFLADTVTLDNVDADNNSGAKYYPFYGCTTQADGTTWNLNVYYKNVSNLTSSTFIIRNTDISCYSHSDGWVWLEYNITLDDGAYSDSFGELTSDLPAAGTLLTALTWQDKNVSEISADTIKSYIINIIDSYTYRVSDNKYIAGYNVYVDNAITLSGGVIKISIEIQSTGKNWYPVTVNNNAVEGITAGSYSFSEYKTLDGKIFFLEDGMEVTLTAEAYGGYELVSITSENGGGSAYDNTYTFTAKEGVIIDIEWQKLEVKSVTVYSDIPFIYNGVGISGTNSSYEITEKSISDETLYADATYVEAASGYENYYFLGWAILNGGSLEFVSTATVDYDAEGISYYAIWGYGGSNSISGYSQNAETSKLGTAETSTTGVTFYGWYSSDSFDESYKITDSAISGTTVYARWNYSFNVAVYVDGKSDLYVNGSVVATFEGSTYTYTIYVPEQSSVNVEYSIGSRTFTLVWSSKTSYHTIMSVTIEDGSQTTSYEIKAYKSGESYSSTGNRYLKPTEYTGSWSYSGTSEPKDEINSTDIATSSAVRIDLVSDNIGISYAVQ